MTVLVNNGHCDFNVYISKFKWSPVTSHYLFIKELKNQYNPPGVRIHIQSVWLSKTYILKVCVEGQDHPPTHNRYNIGMLILLIYNLNCWLYLYKLVERLKYIYILMTTLTLLWSHQGVTRHFYSISSMSIFFFQ